MAHVARFSLDYADEETARRITAAIRPEVGDIEGERTRATIDRVDDVLEVHVTADDIVALRAGLNTWLTLVSVAERSGGLDGTATTPAK